MESFSVDNRPGIIALLLVSLLSACSAPPDFIVEREPPPSGRLEGARALSIGSLTTPPGGEYRFVRMHRDGNVEMRELLTVNGPGRWRAYVGRTSVPASVVRDALATIDATAPQSAPADGRGPCVLAFDPAAGDEWQGCAYPDLASQVLQQVPHLTAPEVSEGCEDPVCQVRLLRHTAAGRREAGDDLLQEVVLDRDGALWCASAEPDEQRQAITMRVERATIRGRDAGNLFAWVTAGATPAAGQQSAASPDAAMVRGHQSGWRPLDQPEAAAIHVRWRQIASRLPASCRLTPDGALR